MIGKLGVPLGQISFLLCLTDIYTKTSINPKMSALAKNFELHSCHACSSPLNGRVLMLFSITVLLIIVQRIVPCVPGAPFSLFSCPDSPLTKPNPLHIT